MNPIGMSLRVLREVTLMAGFFFFFCAAHVHATGVAPGIINKDMPMAGTRPGSGMCLRGAALCGGGPLLGSAAVDCV